MKELFHSGTVHSGAYANRRLQKLLTSERIACTPGMLELLEKDVSRVIARYVSAKPEKLTAQVEGQPPVLMIRIPIEQKR